MIPTLLLGLALHAIGQAPDPSPPPAADLGAYEAERSRAGSDPDAQVKLALWCEAHGLPAQRFRHLALAVLADPGHATARGLMGLVAYQGRWQSPAKVQAEVDEDAKLRAALAEYNRRRATAGNTADAQWRLAVWCGDNGLDAESQAHLTAVVRLDPDHTAAWKRLGCRKVNGRWTSEAQIEADKREAEARKLGDKRWKPLLARWRSEQNEPNRRDEVDRQFAAVTDPYAVASVWSVFVAGRTSDRDHSRAVQLLGQIDAPRASAALATLAVFAESAEVRRSAIETLRRRDTREYLAGVIALLRKRTHYEVRPVGGPGSPGVLFVEGQRFNVQRLYAPPAMPQLPILPGETLGVDAFGLPTLSRYLGESVRTTTEVLDRKVVEGAMPDRFQQPQLRAGLNPSIRNIPIRASQTTETTRTTSTVVQHRVEIPIGQLMLQYEAAAVGAQQQLASDIRAIDASNAAVARNNDRVTQVLRGVTGVDKGESASDWSGWWADSLGYVFRAEQTPVAPTVVENVPLAYLPTGVAPSASELDGPSTSTTQTTVTNSPARFFHACFGAGTPVRTLDGSRPIESIQVGDRVLSQDVETGSLDYRPVLAVFHNRPAETLRIDLGGETVVATLIHRFWKAGQGWVMARDLRDGDRVRTVGGIAEVRSIAPDRVQPVFNLQVAGGHSFFVGKAGALVHDNSVAQPVARPFDVPAVAAK